MSAKKAEKKTNDHPKSIIQLNELSHLVLSRRCQPDSLGFSTTDELPDLQEVIGQPRALRALELGCEVSGTGYNIFILGQPGSGRTTLTQEHLIRKAADEKVPDDWCYVYNFDNPLSPRALRLPPGRGTELKKDLKMLVQVCQRDLSQAFESKEYIQERNRLLEELQKKQEAEFLRLQELAGKYNFLVMRTPLGLILVPAVEGKPIQPEELEKLSEEQQKKLAKIQATLGEEVQKSLSMLRELALHTSKSIDEFSNQTAAFIINPVLEEIRASFQDIESVQDYLSSLRTDILNNLQRFQPREGEARPSVPDGRGTASDWTRLYEVNLFVDNSNLKGAPVIVESHPVYFNLLGRIEHEVFMGASRTDFTMIRPGAFHKANGGYLVLPARDVLLNPYAWEGVKRVLRDGCIRIIELGSQVGLLSTETLDPEPIPLEIKVILVGTPMLNYLLQLHDEDFSKLFKVRAEFATIMDRTPEAEREYGLFAKSVVVDNNLPAFDNTAVSRIIEYSSRLAEDQRKLSTRFGWIADLMREAAFWAKKQSDGSNPTLIVTGNDVQRAIDEAIYRHNLVETRIQENIEQGVLLIDLEGARVGCVNALSVAQLGDYSFGRPSRLTATVSPGRAGVIDIERLAKLGGPIHTKGVLILTGFLYSHYAHSSSLSLSASLTFEQSYGEIEGDSASAAELFTLLSAIARIPLRQDIAVTGSINQHGEIQPIGGVNEKIEGFYEACKARGLTGSQGVLIPAANQRHLMLKEEVRSAVENGQFHVWVMTHFDDGIALLTGKEVGELLPDGSYPSGSFNQLVSARLAEFSKQMENLKGGEQNKSNSPGEE